MSSESRAAARPTRAVRHDEAAHRFEWTEDGHFCALDYTLDGKVASFTHTGVPSAVGAAAYRIVQETLTNAVRHGGPGVAVRVGLRAEPGGLRVTVTDEGTAHPAARVPSAAQGAALGPGGFGLIGNMVVGIIGAFIAGFLFPAIGISLGTGILSAILHATIGAIILLVLIRIVKQA